MHRISDRERRARLGQRHWLAAPRPGGGAKGPSASVALAGDLCGLHATDPATVHLAAWARIGSYSPDALGVALYDEHTAIRMLAMRRTMFVLPTGLAPIIHQACTVKVAATNRKRLVKLLEQNGIAKDGTRWLATVEHDVLAELGRRGEARADELSHAVSALRTKVDMAPGKSYGGQVAITNQVLTHLAAEGRIVRGRPFGGWTSTRYRWAPLGAVTDADLKAVPPAEAEAKLCRQWLATFGPALEADLRWWAGWTAAQAKRALQRIGAQAVQLSAGTGYVLAEDAEPVTDGNPWVALLPALDPTAMGWKQRDFYLDGHADQLFDRSGNIGPTVWSDGRVVGGWAQRADGDIAVEVFTDIGGDASQAIGRAAASLTCWLGQARITPRFRTPLEKRLSS